MAERQAAIDKDIMKRPLGEVSAAEFLQVLNDSRLSSDVVALLPDKKKFELWVDEGGISKIPLGTLLEKIRGEKKKIELEKRLIVENFPKRMREFEVDPRHFMDPHVREGLVEEIVTEVMRRVGT